MKEKSDNSKKRMLSVGGNKDCPHDSLQNLGKDSGNNLYLKCHKCNAVLIVEGDRSYMEERKRLKEETGEKTFFEKMRMTNR